MDKTVTHPAKFKNISKAARLISGLEVFDRPVQLDKNQSFSIKAVSYLIKCWSLASLIKPYDQARRNKRYKARTAAQSPPEKILRIFGERYWSWRSVYFIACTFLIAKELSCSVESAADLFFQLVNENIPQEAEQYLKSEDVSKSGAAKQYKRDINNFLEIGVEKILVWNMDNTIIVQVSGIPLDAQRPETYREFEKKRSELVLPAAENNTKNNAFKLFEEAKQRQQLVYMDLTSQKSFAVKSQQAINKTAKIDGAFPVGGINIAPTIEDLSNYFEM